MNESKLEERVAQLERSNRRAKLLAAGVSAALALTAFTKPAVPAPGVIRAKEFRLVDDLGRDIGSLCRLHGGDGSTTAALLLGGPSQKYAVATAPLGPTGYGSPYLALPGSHSATSGLIGIHDRMMGELPPDRNELPFDWR